MQVPREAISNVDEIPKLLEVTSKLLPCQTECTERYVIKMISNYVNK